MIRTIKKTLGANESVQVNISGLSFRLLLTALPVTVNFYLNGAEVGEASDMEAGFAGEGMEFDSVKVTTVGAQDIKFAISNAIMRYDRNFITTMDINSVTTLPVGHNIIDSGHIIVDSGAVAVVNFPADAGVHIASGLGTASATPLWVEQQRGGAITDAAPVSVGVAATALLVADAARHRACFKNDEANTDFIYLGGAGVTVANAAIRIAPGQAYFETEGAGAAWYGISGTAAQSCRVQTIT